MSLGLLQHSVKKKVEPCSKDAYAVTADVTMVFAAAASLGFLKKVYEEKASHYKVAPIELLLNVLEDIEKFASPTDARIKFYQPHNSS